MYDSQRAGIVRTLSLFFIIWSIFGPIDHRLTEFKTIFFDSTGIEGILNSIDLFWILKSILLLTSVALLKWPENLTLSVFQLVSGILFLSLGVISNSLWNYNTHIVIISILTLMAGLRSKDENTQKKLFIQMELFQDTILSRCLLTNNLLL